MINEDAYQIKDTDSSKMSSPPWKIISSNCWSNKITITSIV